jgi:sugar fermentation stimulation protein A
MLDSGLYIAVFYLPRAQNIYVGKLGQFHFKKGVYFYTGSAQRNLSARLKRHSDRKKSLRWHIDYLSSKARMLGAITIPGPRKRECELVKQLSKVFEVPVRGFGASDCHCSGHLFYAPEATW